MRAGNQRAPCLLPKALPVKPRLRKAASTGPIGAMFPARATEYPSMTKGRVETIDVFRGIAILMVVMFHFTARLPAYALNITEGAPLPVFFGWVGVYFFFIISGYCIFMTLERSST